MVQLGYYGLLFTRFSFQKHQKKSNKDTAVSVIISCKNEATNLLKNIPKIIEQNHSTFELVLVDDASTDTTFSVMKKFAEQYNYITILQIPKSETYTGNKKSALTKAINVSQYENLLFTDADCIPNSLDWISEMTAKTADDKQIVLGYGGYSKSRTWLNKLIRYETLLTAWQYFSYAIAGIPYMGVGRNIAYSKSFFTKANGFENHKHIKSGDDDLFVNQIANIKNTRIVWNKEAHTISEPKKNRSEWIRQKRRHISTATSYKPIHQLLLSCFFLSQFLFFTLTIVFLTIQFKVKTVLVILLLRYIVYYISLIPTAEKLNEKDLLIMAPLLELFLILVQLRIFIQNMWKKPQKWE